MRCSVANCPRYSGKYQVSFHRFPKDPKVRQEWIKRCNRPKYFNPETSHVCSWHFEEGDFLRDMMAETLGYRPKCRLKSKAVPSINLYLVKKPNIMCLVDDCTHTLGDKCGLFCLPKHREAQEEFFHKNGLEFVSMKKVICGCHTVEGSLALHPAEKKQFMEFIEGELVYVKKNVTDKNHTELMKVEKVLPADLYILVDIEQQNAQETVHAANMKSVAPSMKFYIE